MRYLLIFAVIGLLAWRWRAVMRSGAAKQPATRPSNATSIAMEPCRHCGMHVPANETVTGALGVYCSQGHRQLAEP